MSAFDNTDDMKQALADVTNVQTNAKAGPPKDEAAHALARERGWNEPVAYDYATTNNAVDAKNMPNSNWAYMSRKYEWNDEFGEIGPAMPELEEELFRRETINRAGVKLEA